MSGTVAQRRRNVGGAGATQDPDGEIAQRRHGMGGGAPAQARAVFIEGHIADPMQAIFNAPMAPIEIEKACGVGLGGGEAGQPVDHLVAEQCVIGAPPPPLDAKDLPAVGELHVVVERRTGPDPPLLQPAMALIDAAVLRGEKPPGRGVGCRAASWADCL
jgi:hypothetical protein